ncbi:hypothetical protein [Fimbriimonas ginsengisoli]|nr:hypothetical protein [Fimbriimonas ginsengisoli]
MMQYELYRAGRTMYPQTVTAVNQPNRSEETTKLLATDGWAAAATSIHLGLDQIRGMSLNEWCRQRRAVDGDGAAATAEISTEELNALMNQLMRGEITPAQMQERVTQARQSASSSQVALSRANLEAAIYNAINLDSPAIASVGREMLESVFLSEATRVGTEQGDSNGTSIERLLAKMGIAEVSVVTDFPVTTAVYGFTRGAPGQKAKLNPFPRDTHYGRIPVYTDVVEADALIVTLNPNMIVQWLESLGYSCTLPGASSPEVSAKGYFLNLFDGVDLRETIGAGAPEARLVFGALHSLSHISIRQAALLSGLDVTSMSEYLLPRSLSYAIFCNHRFGATIGALVSLFDQSLEIWLESIRENRGCVYDPVCTSQGGVCHSCCHLAETSCRFFNLNLARPMLFGGHDRELGNVSRGYLQFSEE